MANCAQHKNPLERSGTSQRNRALPGLAPGFVGLDERRYSDWIVFAIEFSRYLKFYGADDAAAAPVNGWPAFFAKDASAVLGTFAVQNIDAYRTAVRERLDFLRDNDHAGDAAGLKRNLSEAISAVLTLARALDDYYLLPNGDAALKSTLRKFIAVKLGPAFRRLLSYYKAADAAGFYTAVAGSSWKILNRSLADVDASVTAGGGFSADWWDAASAPDFASIAADDSVFGSGSVFDQVSHAANHFLFSSIFDLFIEAYARLIEEAEASLAASLETRDSHPPHYALFLAFLKLFRVEQAQLNSIVPRHLDYYYRDVLRLRPKTAEPDHVHLVAELAKAASAAALAAGTLFPAGRDSLGRPVLYALDGEAVFNRAEIALHKAVYRIDPADAWVDSQLKNSKRIFAAPVMNSDDGNGAKLQTPLQEWHPLFNRSVDEEGATTAIQMPPAEIGFAVASHYLFLAEGERIIRLRFAGDMFNTFPPGRMRCKLSAEKGWLEKELSGITVRTISGVQHTEIVILVSGTDPAIVAFSPKIHGGGFDTDTPVVQCILKNEAGSQAYRYDDLKNIIVDKIDVEVQVGSGSQFSTKGARQIVVANAQGTIDPAKPFQPWGPTPGKDAPLVVGSKELFSKKNAAFNLHVEWVNRPSSITPSAAARLQFLRGGEWKAGTATLTGGVVSSSAEQKTFASDVTIPDSAAVDYRDAYPGYGAASRAGFARLLLDGGFGQDAYTSSLTDYLIRKSRGELAKNEAEPTKPYLPVVAGISITYKASTGAIELTTGQPAARSARLFHIGPFGVAEQGLPENGESGHFLVPQFRSAEGVDNIGEWYVGIRNLAPQQGVNVLFQLLEGTTIPTLSKPEQHVEWSYWSGNRWARFEDRDVSDSTRQLVQSGIVSFAIPENAALDRGILPHGYIWIRASVTEKTGAVAKILGVFAQAMRATLLPRGNAEDILDGPRPAGTISKLKEPDARIKKVTQPYASFGGRPRETSAGFQLRSSERLRHKGRAVTIWDYEKLVLEAFPQLYKVKCLNHTRIEDNPNASLAIHNEGQPGYVAIVTIPDLSGRNDTNPMKPYTSQAMLSEIREFLKTRVTGQLTPGNPAAPQVHINVCNPLFEEIAIDFTLQLREGYRDFTFYSAQLQEEIVRFLSPWAFGDSSEAQFGGRIAKSTLIDFIEDRPYVDFITDMILKQKPENQPLMSGLEVAVATTSRSILVSAVAVDHHITEYTP